MKDNGQEIFPIVDETGAVVGQATYDGPINPSKEELDGGRFWSMQEIREAMGQEILTPNFQSEFQRFFLTNS